MLTDLCVKVDIQYDEKTKKPNEIVYDEGCYADGDATKYKSVMLDQTYSFDNSVVL